MPSPFDSEDLAQELFETLTTDITVDLPDIDWETEFPLPYEGSDVLTGEIPKLTNDMWTSGEVDGNGVVDLLFKKMHAVLANEYSKNRITGAEYTKAFIAMLETSASTATQFLLGRDQAYWQAVRTQLEAATARVQFLTARANYAATEAQLKTQLANYALTKLKLASEDIGFGSAKFNLEQILPTQKILLSEQAEAARAQTLNSRTDSSAVAGLIGKQKDLYTQQISSYQRDAEMKAARPFIDAWITMKTIDEGLTPPSNLDNTSLNNILAKIKTNNGLT